MWSVSVALLSTLLPTCVLIFMLSCLCVYLYLGRRNSGLPTSDPQSQSQTLEQMMEEERQAKKAPRETFKRKPNFEHSGPILFGRKIYPDWSDASHPDLFKDMRGSVRSGLGGGLDHHTQPGYSVFSDNESRVKEALELLGYRGIPPATVFKLLQDTKTRFATLHHIMNTVVLYKTSLDCDPETSLLPSSPDVRKYILDYMQAHMKMVRGLKCKSLVLIPSQAHLNDT